MLAPAMVDHLRVLYGTGVVSMRRLSKAFGIPKTTVYSAVTGLTWRSPRGRLRLARPVMHSALTRECEQCGQERICARVCQDCQRANMRRRKPELRRLQKYGLSESDFWTIFDMQDGRCAICDERPRTGESLFVDHCHSADVVRGLLCGHCNTMIGMARENERVLRRAIGYLFANCR